MAQSMTRKQGAAQTERVSTLRTIPTTSLRNRVHRRSSPAIRCRCSESRFGYDKYYLSKLIKQKLGKSFTEVKHFFCMEQAKHLLSSTEIPEKKHCRSCRIQQYFVFLFPFYKAYRDFPNRLSQSLFDDKERPDACRRV